MRTGARSVRGHTSSADPASSPPPLRGGASTVRRPPVRRLAASTSTRRLLTRSRPPWLRSSACRRWTGSKPRRRVRPPRQGHGHRGTVQRLLHCLAPGRERLLEGAPQYRVDDGRQYTARQGREHPIDARPGRDERAYGPELLGLAVPRRGHGHAGRAADSGCRRAAGSREDHRTRGPPAGGVPTTGAASTDARGDWMSRADAALIASSGNATSISFFLITGTFRETPRKTVAYRSQARPSLSRSMRRWYAHSGCRPTRRRSPREPIPWARPSWAQRHART